jgi:DNA-binding CsgD family transcriptional regulator/HSP20 family molecular chaperone IbpA
MYELHEASDSGDLNVYAVDERFVVEVPVPGIKARDIEVSLEDRTLTIRAHPSRKTDSAERTYLLHGYEPVSMTRRLRLPDGVDPKSGRGSLEVGLLRLSFRQDAAPGRWRIPVRADGPSPSIVPLQRTEPDSAPSPAGGLPSSLMPEVTHVMPYGRGLLSPREREVLSLLVDGRTNKEIARQLVISVSTVNYHVASVLTKLGAENRTQAATIVSQHRLLLEAGCPD